jgi:hypothetical protein
MEGGRTPTPWLALAVTWFAVSGCAQGLSRDPLFDRRVATFREFVRSLPACASASAPTVAALDTRPAGQRRATVSGQLGPMCTGADVVEEPAILRSRRGPPPRCRVCSAAWALAAPLTPNEPIVVLSPRPSSLLTCDADALKAAAPGLTVTATGTLSPGQLDPWLELELESICRSDAGRSPRP